MGRYNLLIGGILEDKEDSISLQEVLEPHYIRQVGGKRLTTILTITTRNYYSIATQLIHSLSFKLL